MEFEKDKIKKKNVTSETLLRKELDTKQRSRQLIKKEVKLLFRNWNYIKSTNKEEEKSKDKWLIHPRKCEVKEIMHKAH